MGSCLSSSKEEAGLGGSTTGYRLQVRLRKMNVIKNINSTKILLIVFGKSLLSLLVI